MVFSAGSIKERSQSQETTCYIHQAMEEIEFQRKCSMIPRYLEVGQWVTTMGETSPKTLVKAPMTKIII